LERWATREALAQVAREVGQLRRLVEQHEREHETAERVRTDTARHREQARLSARRYWITTLATVLSSNLAVIVLTHHWG